jgi:ribulose-5-phosphate 4-epimerase/fuculose-1-phosphate aldolase
LLQALPQSPGVSTFRVLLVGTSDNLSAILDREPLRLAMSPSGVDKGELRTEQILMIDAFPVENFSRC